MARNSFKALCIYFIIYAIAQGIMDAYEEALEQPYLAEHDVNLEWVGLAQTIDFLPWCFKFIWAIPSDSYDFMGYGHRRPYVVMGILMAAAAFAGLTTFDPGKFLWAYMICMILRNIGVAVADCAVDGLSVDCQMDTEAGAIQGWMSLGRTVGTVLAAVSAGVLAKEYSYQIAIVASAAFMFIPLPANWFILEEWVDEKAYEDKVEDAAVAAVAVKTADKAARGGKGGSGMSMAEAAAAVRKEFEDEERRRQLAAQGNVGLSGGLASGNTCHGGSTMGRIPGLPMPSAEPAGSSSGSNEDPVTLESGTARRDSSAAPDESKGLMSEEESTERAKKALKRRQSFVAKVAVSVGFDWDMLQELLSRRHVYMFLIYLLVSTTGVALTNFSLTAWAMDVHKPHDLRFDEAEVGVLMSVMSVGCFLASLPMGYLFDYIPSKRSTMFFASLCCAVCNLVLIWCDTKAKVYLGLFGFGAAHGVIYVVQCSMARILADMRIAAAFFGIVNSTGNIAHALGTLFGGPIAERINLEANFIVGAAVDFLALAFCLLLPEAELRLSHEDAAEGKMKVLKHRMHAKKTEANTRRTALNTTAEVLRVMDDVTRTRFMALNHGQPGHGGNDGHAGTPVIVHGRTAYGSSGATGHGRHGFHVGGGLGTSGLPVPGGDTAFKVGQYTVAVRSHSAGPGGHSAHADGLGVIQPANLEDVFKRNPGTPSGYKQRRASSISAAADLNKTLGSKQGVVRKPSFYEQVEIAWEEAVAEDHNARKAQQKEAAPGWMEVLFGRATKAKPITRYRRNSAAAAAHEARISGLPLYELAGPARTPAKASVSTTGSYGLSFQMQTPGGTRVPNPVYGLSSPGGVDQPTFVSAGTPSPASSSEDTGSTDDPAAGGATGISSGMEDGQTTHVRALPLPLAMPGVPATAGEREAMYNPFGGAAPGSLPTYFPPPPKPKAMVVDYAPTATSTASGYAYAPGTVGYTAGVGGHMSRPGLLSPAGAQALGVEGDGLDSLADGMVDDVTGRLSANPLASMRAGLPGYGGRAAPPAHAGMMMPGAPPPATGPGLTGMLQHGSSSSLASSHVGPAELSRMHRVLAMSPQRPSGQPPAHQ